MGKNIIKILKNIREVKRKRLLKLCWQIGRLRVHGGLRMRKRSETREWSERQRRIKRKRRRQRVKRRRCRSDEWLRVQVMKAIRVREVVAVTIRTVIVRVDRIRVRARDQVRDQSQVPIEECVMRRDETRQIDCKYNL